MTQVTEWSFRETILIAMIIDKGHVPAFDVAQGWVRCSACKLGWNVRGRVEAETDGKLHLWRKPGSIAACSS